MACCAARGYGYVGVGRFRSRECVHLCGKLRRTNFLPVGPDLESEVLKRGYLSVDSDDEDGAGLEYAYRDQDSESDREIGVGNLLDAVDFC